MKNRHLVQLLTMAVMTVAPYFAFSQVKQIFQVFDFDTKQPVVGATTKLYVQSPTAKQRELTLTTNAQGVAIATLPTDMKGEYLCMDAWRSEGYVYLDRTEESYFQLFQTKDTIKFYMVEMAKYRAEQLKTFESLYRFFYNDEVLATTQQFKDEIKAQPERTLALANNLVEAAFTPNINVRNCRADEGEINRYDLYRYDKPQFQEVIAMLRTGDVNKAVAMAKSHIDMKDNSRQNLEWVEFYRYLKLLEASTDDEDLISDYSEILYRNNYQPYIYGKYMLDLQRDNLFERMDSIAKIEKSNNRIPRYRPYFEPSYFQYLYGDLNPAKLKTTAENSLSINRDNYQNYPEENVIGDLSWMYKNLYLVYALLEDSISAARSVDSAMFYYQKIIDNYSLDAYDRNQSLIYLYQYLLDVVKYNPSYLSTSMLYKLYDDIYNAAKANYENDTANLFLKLQLSENALLWLQNVPDIEEANAKRMEVVKQLVDVDFKLSKDFPEYYTVQNIQAASQLLGNCLMAQCDNDEMQEAFRRYERSFDVVNAQYPKVFIDIYLRFNKMVEGYLAASQMFALSSELSDFNDRLISIKADNDPHKILVYKAEVANEMAESLYQNEMFEESIAYYLQSNEFYQQAMQKNDSLWIPYLTNFLQMGDAHLYQNQYDKAVMTYQKILDFEPQIPASVMPQYTSMKANVSYYIGDVYKSTGDMKRAEKEYKNAEKLFKKAISMGDMKAYQSMGEMYWGKAVAAAQKEDMKTCREMTAKAVIYYEKAPIERPLKRYEQAKSVMGEFYKQGEDAPNYYRTMADLEAYYKKFVNYDVSYASKMVQIAETVLNSGTVTNEEALTYSRDIIDGLIYMNDAGENVQLPYLRGLFNMARAYIANDSVQQAINLYRDCLNMNEMMFKDTAKTSYLRNMAEIYAPLANSYKLMAEDIDTAHSELWYYRAVDTRDTLIDILKQLSADGDVNMTYRTALQYKENALTFYSLDMHSSAQDYLDKSIEILTTLYNSEYKAEVEDDLMLDYYLKGLIYEENNNLEKAKEYLKIVIDYGEKSDIEDGVSRYHFIAVNSLLEILENDPSADAKEVASLKKKQKELMKYFR
jgi:tetratricopeptide (TPR) repeat protein